MADEATKTFQRVVHAPRFWTLTKTHFKVKLKKLFSFNPNPILSNPIQSKLTSKSSTNRMSTCNIFSVFFVVFPILTSSIYYVNPSNNKTDGNGLSWTEAFIHLESALSITSGSSPIEIWLKGDEVYTPNTIDREQCFETTEDVHIYGGFVGNEASKNSRPSQTDLFPSTLSGDINTENLYTDNCHHVFTFSSFLLLDRITISGGYANYDDRNDDYNVTNDFRTKQNNDYFKYGAAIISKKRNFELNLNEITLINNTAINGGALWFTSNSKSNVDVKITNSRFERNHAIYGKYEGGYGGAIYLYQLPNVTVSNTEFIDNFAKARGGAIYQDYGGVFECDQCVFEGNRADGYGGALFSEDRNRFLS